MQVEILNVATTACVAGGFGLGLAVPPTLRKHAACILVGTSLALIALAHKYGAF